MITKFSDRHYFRFDDLTAVLPDGDDIRITLRNGEQIILRGATADRFLEKLHIYVYGFEHPVAHYADKHPAPKG